MRDKEHNGDARCSVRMAEQVRTQIDRHMQTADPYPGSTYWPKTPCMLLASVNLPIRTYYISHPVHEPYIAVALLFATWPHIALPCSLFPVPPSHLQTHDPSALTCPHTPAPPDKLRCATLYRPLRGSARRAALKAMRSRPHISAR